MDIINFTDIVSLISTMCRYNLLLGHISLLCRCGLMLQMDLCGLSVGLSIGHNLLLEPCKNNWTDLDAVWALDSGGPRNHVLDGSRSPHAKGQFWGGKWLAERAVERARTTILLQRNPSFEEMPDQVHFSCRNYVEKWLNMMYIYRV